MAVTLFSTLLTAGTVYAQEPGVVGAGNAPTINSVSTNKMALQQLTLVCGGKAQQGTPIAGNPTGAGTGNHTSGSLTIAGIPALIGGLPTTVVQANLFWSVLTNSATDSSTGEVITFNGAPITGTKIGSANQSPCFPQANTIAWKADVTNLVASPGNGIYTITGAPGGASDFTEGATLQILWSNPNAPLMEDVLYHATGDGASSLALTQAELFSQTLNIPGGTNSSGPVSATLYEVIGNGQSNGGENLRFVAACSPAGGHNFDNTLDGSTSSHAPNTCNSNAGTECFWDDDVLNVSSDFACASGNGATSATLVSNPAVSATNDCFDWPALNLLTSTDQGRAADLCGAVVDRACPADGTYDNHGAYVSCVAHAAEDFLAGLPLGGSCPREEVQSACVNPRARSNVGKK